jgi:hypothetical protein
VYDGYATSVAFSLSDALGDAFCHAVLYRKHVNLGFNRGAELPDPDTLLDGTGKLIRHVRITTVDDARARALRTLINESIGLALSRMKRAPEPGRTVIKSGK